MNASGSRRIERVGWLAALGMTSLMALVVGRVAQLQTAPSEALLAQRQERTTTARVPGTRGDVLDAKSRLLATTRFGSRVFVDPERLDPKRVDQTIAELSDVLALPPEEIATPVLQAIARNERIKAARGTGVALVNLRSEEPPTETSIDLAGDGERADDSSQANVLGEMKLSRYVRISGVVNEAIAAAVTRLKIAGVHLEQRPVREYPVGELAAAVVGLVDVDHGGALGAERRFETTLKGRDGRLEYVRDAMGRPLWIDPEGYQPAERGNDVKLSIDLEIQRIAMEELHRGIDDADAAGGRVIVMDSWTGGILAMGDVILDLPELVDLQWEDIPGKGDRAGSGALYEPSPSMRGPRPRFRIIKPDPARLRDGALPAMFRNRCVEDLYEPGSTFKPFAWSAVTAITGMSDDRVFETGGKYWKVPYGRRIVHDVHPHDSQTWREVLINSSNIGMSMSVEMVEREQLSTMVRKLGFGRSTGTGLPGETSGMVTPLKQWSKYTQTSVSFGQEIGVTPVQMARAFSVFARPGELAGTLPEATLVARERDGGAGAVATRVLPVSVAERVREILRVVAAKIDDNMARLPVPEKAWRYSIFGKSGTASVPMGHPPKGKRAPMGMRGYFERQYMSSFIAGAPAEKPRLVVLCIIDDPGPSMVRKNMYYGSIVAGPVVRRVMERSLAYLGTPPSPPEMMVVERPVRKPGERDE